MRAFVGWAIPWSVAAVITAGCNHQARQDTTARADRDGAELDRRPHRAAVTSITNARCDREQRCGNIGPDAKFDSRNACVARIREDWADQLNASECPHGVRKVELDECLQDIRTEECGDPFDTLARTFSCGRSEICERDPG